MYKAERAQKPATYTQSLTLKIRPPPLFIAQWAVGIQQGTAQTPRPHEDHNLLE